MLDNQLTEDLTTFKIRFVSARKALNVKMLRTGGALREWFIYSLNKTESYLFLEHIKHSMLRAVIVGFWSAVKSLIHLTLAVKNFWRYLCKFRGGNTVNFLYLVCIRTFGAIFSQ